MKNIVLGMIGGAVAIYLIVCCLSIYSISSRKNEMENCISQVLEQNLLNYYGGSYTDEEVKAAVKEDLLMRLQSDSRVTVNVRMCDVQQGIISVNLQEEFYLPTGMKKVVECDKTIIAEEVETDEASE